MVEAMACGTPVIAFRAGSVPEIIDDGLTGFVVDPDEVIAAVCRIWNVDRQNVRKRFAQRFTEPPRVSRRLFGLSHAAIAGGSSIA
jgi:glycosyltransferase involved in cell wall biosynthesis